MICKPTPEDQARIDAHWADVRAGIYKSAPHVYSEDATPTIEMHRFRANMLVAEAARHAQAAINLAAEGQL